MQRGNNGRAWVCMCDRQIRRERRGLNDRDRKSPVKCLPAAGCIYRTALIRSVTKSDRVRQRSRRETESEHCTYRERTALEREERQPDIP